MSVPLAPRLGSSLGSHAAPWAGSRSNVLAIAGIAALWVTLMFVGFYPGLLSGDPLYQLDQGISGVYSNVQSPVLSWALGIIYRLSGSVWPAFLLQLVTLSAFAGFLAQRATRRGAAIAVLISFLFMPPIWSTVAAVWKDNAMTSTLLLGIIAVLYRRPVVAIVLLALAASMRLNAVLAVVPLLVPISAQLSRRWNGKWLARSAVFGACLVSVVMTPRVIDRILSAQDSWALAWVLTDDLGSIYSRRPELYPGSMFEKVVDAQQMAALYSVGTSTTLFFGPPPRIDLYSLPAHKQELKSEWLRIVKAAPGTYLKARVARFGRLLGLDRLPVHYPFHINIDPNPYGLKVREHTMLHRALRRIQDGAAETFLFRGWFWMSLLLVVSVIAFVRRHRQPLALWVAASGLAYLGGYFLVGPAADFRYLYWPLVTVFVTALLLLGPDEAKEPRGAESAA